MRFLHSMVVYYIGALRDQPSVLLSGKGVVDCKWKRGFV